MPAALTCVLSYGLMCSPAEVVDVPTPTPLEPVAAADPPDPDPADPTPSTPSTPPKGKATLILTQVQGFYDGTTDLRAAFTQTHVNAVYNTKTVSKGTLKVKKPGKMVWDYADEKNPDIWVSGKTVHVVELDTKQVVKRTLDTSDFAGAEKFLFGGRKLLDDFRVRMAKKTLAERYGMKGHSVVELAPKKKNPHYDRLLLVVDDATGRVDSFIVRNTDKSTNRFDLAKIERNPGQADSVFDFSKPKGFIVITD